LKYIKSFFLFFLFLTGLFAILNGQQSQPAKVYGKDNTLLKYPWAGGMNSIQFGAVDVNRDGIKDLVAFDRNGNRMMCFVNSGVYKQIDYVFAPQYVKLLPDISDWAIFADYDRDGKTDIFAYSPDWAGIQVYKNVSNNTLKFKRVVYPYLKSFQENMYINLLVTEADYPAIADLDYDGDLDILSFWGYGSFVNYHKNLSMEKYGTPDSLDYTLEEYCWGRIAESDESNAIYLDTCFTNYQPVARSQKKDRHTGSTFLMIDLNRDSVLDLLLGDVDYPTLFALYNGGTREEAYITSFDTSYPPGNKSIGLFSMPVAAYIDVNNDFVKDMLVSPFDPTPEKSQNKHSVWLYMNTGANDHPFFTRKSKNFLQSQMIDRGAGAYPVIFDWNADGLDDLFIGDYGFYQYSYYDDFKRLHSVHTSKIAWYRNTGTTQQPAFTLMNDDVGDLFEKGYVGLIPAFADLDGDGDVDMLAGYETGKLILATNDGNDNLIFETDHYANIDVGDFSAPQLFDLDGDGAKDLIIGEKRGTLYYYHNDGTAANPVFTLVNDSLGEVNVTDYALSYTGYSTPWFFRIGNGPTQLVVGSEQGKIFHYTNIDGNLNGKFTLTDGLDELLDTTGVSWDRGMRTAAAIGDINHDGQAEMIVGNYSGGLEYFNGTATVSPGISSFKTKKYPLNIFPNPVKNNAELTISSNKPSAYLTVFTPEGRRIYSKKIGLNNGTYRLETTGFQNGLYIVKINTRSGVFTGKMVVAR